MRILHLHAADLDDPLGRERGVRTHELYRRLARHHAVTVLAPGHAGRESEALRDGVRYLRLGGRGGRASFVAALWRGLRRLPADLLVEEWLPGVAPWGAWLRPAPLPLVASVQGFDPSDIRPACPLASRAARPERVRRYRHCVVTADSTREQVQALHPQARCRAIPDGVDDALFRTDVPGGRGILYQGPVTLSSHGIDLLLQAYARVPVPVREPLTLAGPVHDPAALQAVLRSSGLADQVRLVDDGDGRQRARLFQQCRFVVMPSRQDGGARMIAEANAAARPVVLWDRAPLNEVASRACLRVPAFDVPAFTQAMTSLLQASRDELQLRGLHARAHARRFDWAAAADAQERFYLECLADRPGHGSLDATR